MLRMQFAVEQTQCRVQGVEQIEVGWDQHDLCPDTSPMTTSYPNTDHPSNRRVQSPYALYIVQEGEGHLWIEDICLRVTKGTTFILRQVAVLRFAADTQGMRLLEISFNLVPNGRAEPDAAILSLPLSVRLSVQPLSKWMGLCTEMSEAATSVHALELLDRQVLFLRMLLYLCTVNPDESERPTSTPILKSAAEAMRNHPDRPMRMDEWARRGHMGIRQFASQFKEMTGQSPHDYHTLQRMNRSKLLLLFSQQTIGEIAAEVGFSDIYYFSRRFKQLFGYSPRQFRNRQDQEPRVVALYHTGNLLALGIKPIAANLTWWGGSSFLREYEAGIIDVGIDPSLREIAALQPDLILIGSQHLYNYDRMSRIAPTLAVPYDSGRSVFDECYLLGQMLGREGEARRLEQRFLRKAATARRRLRAARIRPERQRALIIRIERQGATFCVFGDNYGRSGAAIYHGLGYHPAQRVAQLMASGVQYFPDLPIAELPIYMADCDLVLLINEGEGRENVPAEIWEQWKHIDKERRLLELDKKSFSYFDPISVEGQVERLAFMLTDD